MICIVFLKDSEAVVNDSGFFMSSRFEIDYSPNCAHDTKSALVLPTIKPKGRKIAFYHERNLLRNIWLEPAVDTLYPAFLWNIFHEPEWSNSGSITLAESIRGRWQQFEFGGKASGKEADLLFGKGGYYHADELHKRAAILNQLQSSIRSINQDLMQIVEILRDL